MNEQITFGFDVAVKLLKEGKKVKRSGWNGKNQYISIGKSISFINVENEIINQDHETMGNAAIVFYGSAGIQVGWLASQADILSDDWMVIE